MTERLRNSMQTSNKNKMVNLGGKDFDKNDPKYKCSLSSSGVHPSGGATTIPGKRILRNGRSYAVCAGLFILRIVDVLTSGIDHSQPQNKQRFFFFRTMMMYRKCLKVCFYFV